MSVELSQDAVALELNEFLQVALRQPVQVEDDIFATGMANSMFALELVVYMEERYDLTLESEDLNRDNFRSARAMSQLVTRRAAAKDS
ncbi:MAG: phosphopantetheine-binding protein [Actinomycetota bacterium]|nr:phosphopantetheine-binding protein [Actinomycetota bacterium]